MSGDGDRHLPGLGGLNPARLARPTATPVPVPGPNNAQRVALVAEAAAGRSFRDLPPDLQQVVMEEATNIGDAFEKLPPLPVERLGVPYPEGHPDGPPNQYYREQWTADVPLRACQLDRASHAWCQAYLREALAAAETAYWGSVGVFLTDVCVAIKRRSGVVLDPEGRYNHSKVLATNEELTLGAYASHLVGARNWYAEYLQQTNDPHGALSRFPFGRLRPTQMYTNGEPVYPDGVHQAASLLMFAKTLVKLADQKPDGKKIAEHMARTFVPVTFNPAIETHWQHVTTGPDPHEAPDERFSYVRLDGQPRRYYGKFYTPLFQVIHGEPKHGLWRGQDSAEKAYEAYVTTRTAQVRYETGDMFAKPPDDLLEKPGEFAFQEAWITEARVVLTVFGRPDLWDLRYCLGLEGAFRALKLDRLGNGFNGAQTLHGTTRLAANDALLKAALPNGKMVLELSWPVGLYDPSSCMHFSGMFKGNASFNYYIGSWNMDNANDVSCMFQGCERFNQPLDGWFLTEQQWRNSVRSMFEGASAFNQPVDHFRLGTCQNFSRMFFGATAFNQPVAKTGPGSERGWNMSSAQNLNRMFEGATSFNQPVEALNPFKVTTVERMFANATSFAQPVEAWFKATEDRERLDLLRRPRSSDHEWVKAHPSGPVPGIGTMFDDATAFLADWDQNRLALENYYKLKRD